MFSNKLTGRQHNPFHQLTSEEGQTIWHDCGTELRPAAGSIWPVLPVSGMNNKRLHLPGSGMNNKRLHLAWPGPGMLIGSGQGNGYAFSFSVSGTRS